jgi:hypothetical protein
VIYINTVPHQANFLAPLPGIEEEEAPTSTTFSHVNNIFPRQLRASS